MDFSRLILVSVPERFSVLEVKERDKNRDSKLVVYKLRGIELVDIAMMEGCPEPDVWIIVVR